MTRRDPTAAERRALETALADLKRDVAVFQNLLRTSRDWDFETRTAEFYRHADRASAVVREAEHVRSGFATLTVRTHEARDRAREEIAP